MIHADTLWRIAGRDGLWSRPAEDYDGMFSYEGLADSSRGIRYGSCANDPCSGVVAAAASDDIGAGTFDVATLADSNRIVRRVASRRWISAKLSDSFTHQTCRLVYAIKSEPFQRSVDSGRNAA